MLIKCNIKIGECPLKIKNFNLKNKHSTMKHELERVEEKFHELLEFHLIIKNT